MIKKIVDQLREILIRRIEIQAVKGYYDIQETNSDLINEIKNKIADYQLKTEPSVIENIIFPKNINIQLSLHQYLLITLLGNMFSRFVLFCIHTKKKLIYPLPLPWLRIIDSSGVKVSYFWSSCLFYFFILISWFTGLINLFRQIFKNTRRTKGFEQYSYFFQLDKKCFPSSRDKDSHDIVSWYINKYSINDAEKNRIIVHSVPDVADSIVDGHNIIHAVDYVPRISFLNFYFKFLPTALFVVLASTLSLKWRNMVLLGEIIDMYAFKFADNRQVAEKYFFTISHLIYRPLWTYIAETKGSSLIFFWYACHIATYKEPNKEYSTVPSFFQVTNWPKHLIWNETHAEYIRNVITYPSDVEVVGPIGYEDNSMALPRINKLSVLAFDIQPLKYSFCLPATPSAQWYSHDYKARVDFYKDIQEICSELGVDLFFKRKRNSPLVHKGYWNFLKAFVKNDNVVEIDPDISAFRLCKQFDVVLSLPFTSTAVIADYYGKESIYYDPTGKIEKSDRAAHQLTVINKKNELRNYLEKIFKTKKI